MVALPIGEVRAVGAPRRRLVGRFSSGHLVMIVAGLLGMVLGIAALRHEPEGVEVAVAAHEIHAGETVTAADFRSTRVRMQQRLLATLVRSSRVGELRGHIATATIASGELVIRRNLRPRAAKAGLPRDEHPDRSFACRRRSPGHRRPHRCAVRGRPRGLHHRARRRSDRGRRQGQGRHRRDQQPLHGHDRGRRRAVAVARGGDRRRRHLARPHYGSALVAGHRATTARPGRRTCRRPAVRRAWNPPLHWSSRPSSGSNGCITTSPTTAARACARSCSSPRSRSRMNTTPSS